MIFDMLISFLFSLMVYGIPRLFPWGSLGRNFVIFLKKPRGGSRGMSNSCIGEQKSSYLLRKTKLKQVWISYTGVRRTLNLPLKT